MFTTILFKKNLKFNMHIGHVYEHIFINSFYDFLEENKIEPGLVGWVNGDVFDDFVLIEAGFYDEDSVKLFEEFAKKYKTNLGCLDLSLEQIRLEIQENISEENINKQLNILDEESWVRLDDMNKVVVLSQICSNNEKSKKS